MEEGCFAPGRSTLFHIDDEPLLAELLGATISSWPEVSYLGFATDAASGVRACEKHQPSIVLLDLGLGEDDGFSVISKLNRMQNKPNIIVLTDRADPVSLHRVAAAKTAGFVWKTHGACGQLRAAIQAVVHGQSFFPRDFLAAIGNLRRSPSSFYKILTDVQQELLPHFGMGLTDGDIASLTGRSSLTIKWHRRQIFSKLGLHRTADLLSWTRKQGFVNDERPAMPCMVARTRMNTI